MYRKGTTSVLLSLDEPVRKAALKRLKVLDAASVKEEVKQELLEFAIQGHNPQPRLAKEVKPSMSVSKRAFPRFLKTAVCIDMCVSKIRLGKYWIVTKTATEGM